MIRSPEVRQGASTASLPFNSLPCAATDSSGTGTSRSKPETWPQLGPWRLRQLLHDGRFTSNYSAVHESFDSGPPRYFIKVVRDQWRDESQAIAQLQTEALVGRCVRHRHVAPVLSAQVHRPPYHLVEPLLAGINIERLLKRFLKIDVPVALWIVRQAAEGLAGLHLCGYLHGDLAARNIIVAANGHATLIDLSCARRLDDLPSLEPQFLCGTPRYWAPELFAGRHPEARSEIYSLGMVLFELLAGRLPFAVDNLAELSIMKRTAAMPDVRSFAPQVPREVAELVRQLTARDPLRRPHPVGEVIERLLRLEIVTLRERLPA